MKVARAALAGSLALLLCAAGVWLWLSREGAAGTAPVAEAPAPAGAAAVGEVPVRWAPLPAAGQPLRLVAAELRARADRGDARAACRLAAEAMHCDGAWLATREAERNAERTLAQVAKMPVDASTRERVREQQAAAKANLAATRARCGGVDPLDPAERVHYWRQAALAGHPAAMRQYAVGNAFRWRDMVEVAPQLVVYRREAESVATRAARAGDLDLAIALGLGYLGTRDDPSSRPFLAQVLRPDPARALAWLQAARAHPAVAALPAGHPMRERLDAGLEKAAEQLPLDMPVPPPETLSVLAGVVPRVDPRNGGIGDIDPTACDAEVLRRH
ncbi:hypothetical protein CO641_11315 [Lysobacteraceae bacterium NML91-0213]|nr:hypothetical protein CO641_11315 [Xanthomonadaceae bacterium NML91-0213]